MKPAHAICLLVLLIIIAYFCRDGREKAVVHRRALTWTNSNDNARPAR